MGAFRFLTAGESHGPSLGVTIEGVPAGVRLPAEDADPATRADPLAGQDVAQLA